jgi:hypothetical protein
MTKTEKELVSAIEAKDQDLALQKFEEYQALKSSTDEQSEIYFNQIENLNSVGEEKAPVVEVVEVVKEEIESVEVDEELPIETRGKKAKDVDRKEIENDLEALITKALSFNQKVSRAGNGDARFAKRISRELVNIRKRLVR